MTKQIPPGYKQTKVGIIPEDWKVVKLGNVLKEKPKYGINAPAVEYSNSLPTYLRITDIDADGYFNPDKKASVDEKDYKDFILKENEIVFARTGATVGKSYLYNKKDGELVYAGFLIKVAPNTKKLNSVFLKNFTDSHKYWNWIKLMSARSGQPGVNGEEYSIMPIPLPPLREQEKIAEILSTWDDAITKQQQLIEQKQVFKKGIMQQIFSQRLRFIEFKENWKTVNVGSFMIERNKQIPKSDKYPLMAFAAYKGVTEKGDRYDREFLVTDEENKKYKQTEYGDFIYSSNNLETGSIGLNKYGSATISPVYSIFQIMKSSDYIFISNLLVTKKFINSMVRYRQGVIYGQWRIHESDFLKIKVSVPCLEEQTKIADFLTSIDDEITKQTEILEQLKLQKQSLMQKLLTGQVRVKI